jgi:hypothetical protein
MCSGDEKDHWVENARLYMSEKCINRPKVCITEVERMIEGIQKVLRHEWTSHLHLHHFPFSTDNLGDDSEASAIGSTTTKNAKPERSQRIERCLRLGLRRAWAERMLAHKHTPYLARVARPPGDIAL